MRRLDSLGLLETFTRIVERGSISAAAKDLGTSQPTVSRQLVELEERLGSQLLQRTTHALHLTPAGEACLEEARVLLGRWDALVERCNEEQTLIKGSLTVVAPIVFGQVQLAELVSEFLIANPQLSLRWVLTDELISFSEFGCDLWLKVGQVKELSLQVEKLWEIERILVAAPSLAQEREVEGPGELGALPFLALSPFEGLNVPLRKEKEHAEFSPKRARIVSNNLPALLTAVRSGAGFAVMPRWLVEKEIKNGELVQLLPGWRAPNLDFNMIYRAEERQPLRLRRFLQYLREHFHS